METLQGLPYHTGFISTNCIGKRKDDPILWKVEVFACDEAKIFWTEKMEEAIFGTGQVVGFTLDSCEIEVAAKHSSSVKGSSLLPSAPSLSKWAKLESLTSVGWVWLYLFSDQELVLR